MKLKLIVDKLEDVEEAYRPLYVERDGKFHLEVDGIEDNTTIKADLRKAQREAAERRKLTEKWEKLGKTPEEIEELLTKLEKDEVDKLTQKGEWDKLKQQMLIQHEAALKAKDTIIAAKDNDIVAMRNSLESHLVDSQATAAIAQLKGSTTLLLPHVKKHVKVIQDEGTSEYSVQVVDAKGTQRVNAKGEPLSVADLIQEMRSTEIFGPAFEGSGTSGSGASPGNGGGNQSSVKRRSEFKTERERADFVDAHGMDAYTALPA